MFSANENILLRQHKKRVVDYVESTIPEQALDLGINVMAMQVTCTTPGCVPIETAIIVIFPKLNNNNNNNAKELLPGLPESATGGSYKTKILKPLAEVTKEDVLDALPPAFMGGTKSIEKLCYQIRDNVLVQITQLFDDYNENSSDTKNITRIPTDDTDNNNGKRTSPFVSVGQRQLVAQYIQECLQQYIEHDCIPPEIGQPYPDSKNINGDNDNSAETEILQPDGPRHITIPSTGNFTIPRPLDNDINSSSSSRNVSSLLSTIEKEEVPDTLRVSSSSLALRGGPISLVNSSVQRRQQRSAVRSLQGAQGAPLDGSRSLLAQIASAVHSRGIRRPGCPCCDPDNASNVVDQFLSQT